MYGENEDLVAINAMKQRSKWHCDHVCPLKKKKSGHKS